MFEAPRQIQSAAAGGANVAVDLPADGGIDVRQILAVLWRGKATILWTTAASLLLAFLLVLVVPHRYTAATQILIDPTDLHAIGNDLTPTNLANDANVLQVESQVRVLTSDSVLRRVVKTEGLDKDTEFTRQGMADGADSTTAALIALKRSIQVKRAERTYVVDVSVTTREPAKSARIANAIAARLPPGTNRRPIGRCPAGLAIAVVPSQRAQEPRSRGRGSGRSVQGPQQHPRRQRTAGQRAAAHRDEQSAERGARPHRRGESAPRPGRAGAAYPRTKSAPFRRRCSRRPSPRCAANTPRSCAAKPSR